MTKLSDMELRHIIGSGETTTVELKVAPPRPAELAERLCGMANSLGGLVITVVELVLLVCLWAHIVLPPYPCCVLASEL